MYRAVTLIGLSLLIAVGAELLERRKAAEEKLEADRTRDEDIRQRLEETNRLLAAAYGAIAPIGDVEATLSFDLTDDEVPGYGKRLKATAKTWKPNNPFWNGFLGTHLFAPGVPAPLFGTSRYAKDEMNLAKSLKAGKALDCA